MESVLTNFSGWIICVLIFICGNRICQFIASDRTLYQAGFFQSLFTAVAGIVLYLIFTMISEFDQVREIAFYTGIVASGITILSLFFGLLIFLISGDFLRLKCSFFILIGLFNTDSKEASLSSFFHLLSRFTWELPQTLLGYFFAQTMNCIGRVGEVQLIAGATFCLHYKYSMRRKGVSIGPFIYVSLQNREIRFEKDPLLLHEYGHHLQSRRYGWFYLFIIGIPSLLSAIRAKPLPGGITTHDLQWYEMQANRYAADYLQVNFMAEWALFEPPFNSFPRSKPLHFT